MRITSIRVRNFRSIATEQIMEVPERLTIVGPNNSGKTNLLRAIRMFFTGFENEERYDRINDLTFGKTREQTTLVAQFASTGTAADQEAFDTYDRLLALYEPKRSRDNDEFQVQLIFSMTGNPTYRLSSDSTSKVPRENQGAHSRLLHDLVDQLRASFSIHYVPSSSSSEQLFEELVSPLLKSSVAKQIRTEIDSLVKALDSVSFDLTQALTKSGLDNFGVRFGIPDINSGLYLSYFDFDLSDPEETSIFDKGRGIQSLAMFACFAWIAEEEAAAGLNSIWLIEEPESYLNPELYTNALRLLAHIGASAQVITTTHALGMVPSDPEFIVGSTLDDARTVLRKYSTAQEATASLRASLGVRFSDYFALSEFNVFVEGESDLRYLEWAATQLGATSSFPALSRAAVRSFGGTSDLAGFLRANYTHIRPERAVVTLFDGDAAGVKAARDTNAYLSNKGSSFQANVDYVVVRSGHAIEGLFPDEMIIEAYQSNPAWFETWLVDASAVLIEFKIRDQSKRAFEEWVKRECESLPDIADWSSRWITVLEAIDNALLGWRPGRS